MMDGDLRRLSQDRRSDSPKKIRLLEDRRPWQSQRASLAAFAGKMAPDEKTAESAEKSARVVWRGAAVPILR